MGILDVGDRLRSHREALGWSIDDLARRTRVQPRILDAIERNDLPQIPPKPYGRGFVRAYASEVGLDPDAAVREFFGQFPPAPPGPEPVNAPEPWPRESSWILPAAGLLVAALVLAAIAQGSRPAPRPEEGAIPVGTAGSAPQLEGATTGTTAIGTAAEGPAEDAASRARTSARMPSRTDVPGTRTGDAGFSVMLVADRVCWVTATADGSRVLYELLQPGSRHTIRADREVTLRAGDAGALRVAVNGGETDVLGRDGQVRTVRITAPGALTEPGGRRAGAPPPFR